MPTLAIFVIKQTVLSVNITCRLEL